MTTTERPVVIHRELPLTCSNCMWSGRIKKPMSLDIIRNVYKLADSHCPKCMREALELNTDI